MIQCESSDWCGIGGTFVFWTNIPDDELALDFAIAKYSGEMEEYLKEEYEEDEKDDASFNYSAEWYTPEVYGSDTSSNGAYQQLNTEEDYSHLSTCKI